MKNCLWRAAIAASALLFTAFGALAQTGAGTTPLSLVQQFSISGTPLANCQVYFYVPGTVATPQQIYADYGLTQPLPNPLQCDQSGRVPLHWLAAGLTHIRLVDSSGVVQVDTTMQVLGPSSGGAGGGTTVDPTTILATGDMKAKYGTGPLTGFVRANGLTIGSATSGATERANSDTQNLFIYLWNADPNLAVSGGRGASASADWAANKTIALPDLRGRVIAGLDDMGNSAAGRLTTTYFGTNPDGVLGAAGGSQGQTLVAGNIPQFTFTPSGAVTVTNSATSNFAVVTTASVGYTSSSPGPVGLSSLGATATFSGNPISIGNASPSLVTTIQPAELMTFYIKL